MRIPLAATLESRDGTVDQDAKVMNALVEVKGEKGEQTFFRKRPGIDSLGLINAGTAQLLTVWNGIRAIQGDVLASGTIATVISAPDEDTLTTANDNLRMDAQATNSDAATPRLFFKSREKGWVITRAGAVSTVTYGGSMGGGTYPVSSITRSGTVATATMTEDVFNVGDTATVAGADQADYNGAQTVTAVTEASSEPPADISITSLTRSGTTATATTSVAHGLTNGSSYTIAGANQSAYNGSKAVTVTGTTTFTYTVTVTPGATVTWNSADKDADITLSGSDLIATGTAGNFASMRATLGKSTGKWYWEVTQTSWPAAIGVATSAAAVTDALIGNDAYGWSYYSGASKFHNGSGAAYGATYTTGDVIGVALDMDSGTLTFYKNGVSQGQAFSGLSGTVYPAGTVTYANADTTQTANFGATAFAYSIPSGFSALDVDDPISPATGTIIVTRPGATINPTFTYTVAGSPATPATGTITVAAVGGTVPGIAYINGYFNVMDLNGVIWSSNSDDPTTWGATAFVTAQVENGLGKALGKSQNYLLAFKEWSTEFFYDAQNATGSPFSPVDNGFTRVGCASGESLAEVDGNLFWIAQAREEGRSVYMMRGLEQAKVSTPDIDRILEADDLATVHAYGLSEDGHALYLLTLVTSNITLVYDLTSKMWMQWSSLALGASVNVTSITRSGDIATVTAAAVHGLVDGDPVQIYGANQTEYNKRFQVQYVSTTVFKIKVSGNPTTPATGTITMKGYTETYFKFTKATAFNGTTLLLHESDGYLTKFDSDFYYDKIANLVSPINVFARTARMDGGSTGRKKMPFLRLIGDSVDEIAMVRWSDDDCATFSAYRIVDLDDDEPELRRCGAFKRRTIELRYVSTYQPLQLSALETEITT